MSERNRIAQLVQGAMGCERRAHYGNVEQPYCGKHGGIGQWPCPESATVTAAVGAYVAALLGVDPETEPEYQSACGSWTCRAPECGPMGA